MKSFKRIDFLKSVLNRASAAGTATSLAFVAEEFLVTAKSLHMSSQAAYEQIKFLSSYVILITALIEPVVEILIDKFKIFSTQTAQRLAKTWYALLDISYTACISLYFLDSFNNKSPNYWYVVALPSVLIALVSNKELRMLLGIFPRTNSSKLHKRLTQALGTLCEITRGFILGYDVIYEISNVISLASSLWLSTCFGLIYGLFHGAVYHLKQIQIKQIQDKNHAGKLGKWDASLQMLFNLLTTLFFSFYIKEAIVTTYPDAQIQIAGYILIIVYIIGRSCFGPKKQPLLDKVGEEEEEIVEEK